MATTKYSHTRWVGCLIAASWVIVAILVGPSGDFALSDDWSYGWTVRGLCERGELAFLPWTGASLVLQAWYGWALCEWFGFSFTVLRISTLVLAGSGLIGFFLLLRRAGLGVAACALGVALLGFNPLFLNLSFSFMTDVPFVVAVVWASYFYLRGLGEDRLALLFFGSAFCCAAVLIRQHGIFVAAAAALAILVSGRGGFSTKTREVVAVAALPSVAIGVWLVWLFFLHGAPAGIENKVSEAAGLTLVGLGNTAFRGLAYIGLFLIPLALSVFPARLRERSASAAIAAVIFGAAAFFLYLREKALMFYLPNLLYDFGLGALTLRDVLFLGFAPPGHMGPALGVVVTSLSVASAALLCATWHRCLREPRDPQHAFLLYALVLTFAGTLLHTAFYFDRYLLAPLPFAIATVLRARGVRRIGFGPWIVTLVIAFYSVAGTHDYMAWNRARYQGLAELSALGVGPEEIDGGFEYNAWHLAAKLGTWPTKEQTRLGKHPDRKSWWWVVDDRFVLSFSPLEGYSVRREIPYSRWLLPGRGKVLVLERV
ncbi:MAG: ArnT family glycosyltransferase [Candidatus Binatia bacterium]